jgi:hypothetical protein
VTVPPHESRLLLSLLRQDWETASVLTARQTPDPAIFVETARLCDVAPWLHSVIDRAGRWDLTGDEIRDRLAAIRHKTRSDNLLLLARVEQLLDLLLAEKIVPVALKGLDFLHRFYERFDQRGLDDVDILVHPDQREKTVTLMEEAGYTGPTGKERLHWLRSSYELPMESPGPVPVSVEIHWGLGQSKRYDLSVDEILQRAVPMTIEGRQILRLDDHDSAAHLLLHHLQHYFDRRLKWMLDFGRLVSQESFDWTRLTGTLRSWGGLAAGGISLLHMSRLFPGLVPAEGSRAVPPSTWRRLATLPLRSGHPLEIYRWTRKRWVQLFLAGVMMDRPYRLPGYLLHMAVRDRREETDG